MYHSDAPTFYHRGPDWVLIWSVREIACKCSATLRAKTTDRCRKQKQLFGVFTRSSKLWCILRRNVPSYLR